MNSINIIGRLTKEIERRAISSGNSEVAKFTIAVDAETKEKATYFFDCECWDELGKLLWENCRKGDRIGITGKLVQYKFKRRDGTDASAVKILVQKADFLSPKHPEPSTEILDNEISDDDIPF